MTTTTYKLITRICFVVGAIAVFCFSRFPTSILPKIFLIGAGLVSTAAYFSPRVKNDNEDDCVEEVPKEKVSNDVTVPQTVAFKDLTSPENRRVVSPEAVAEFERQIERQRAAMLAKIEAEKSVNQYYLEKRRQYLVSRATSALVSGLVAVSKEQYLTMREPALPSWMQAVEIAKSLGSNDYNVTLMPDGQIKISRVSKHHSIAVETMTGKQQFPKLEDLLPLTPVQ